MNTTEDCYDRSKIGKVLSWGGDHIVFNYENDKVIKFSLIEFLMGKNGGEKVKIDYLISKIFFGDYVLNVELKKSRNGKFSAAIQTKVFGRYLAKEDLDDPVIRKQFKEIMVSYQNLISAGNSQVDLVGRGGVFKNCMSNIFVTPSKQLIIIDATLLEFEGMGFFSFIFFIVRKIAVWRNNSIIKLFMKSIG